MTEPLHAHALPDGRTLEVWPYLFNDRVIISTDPTGAFYDEAWCFVKGLAVEAVKDWDGLGYPPGPWIKNPVTGEYGPGLELL